VCDERHPEECRRSVARRVGTLHHFHAAALAAAAGVDLRLHDNRSTAELRRGGTGVIGRERHARAGHGNSERFQEILTLMFMNFHRTRSVPARPVVGQRAGQSREADRDKK
jgi:hypothetical protein